MSAVSRPFFDAMALPTPTSLTPDELRAMDEEDRKKDDSSEGIDWDNIIATTQADFEAGNFAFNSANYPSHDAAMAALDQWLDLAMQEALSEVVAISIPDAASA